MAPKLGQVILLNMAGDIYGNFEFAQKSFTRGDDIGKAQLGVGNLNPALFLEIKKVSTHNHTGVDSQMLTHEATPEMVRGHTVTEREEHGTISWTGSAAASGSVAITFGAAFQSTPNVFLTPDTASANYTVAVGARTTTGCTVYWKVSTGTATSVDIQYLIKGR